MSENLEINNSLQIQAQIADTTELTTFNDRNRSSYPRILFEGYPLTLKKGTGIYVYALNLLRGIDSIVDRQQIGLLLLLDESIRLKRSLNESLEIKNIRNYAESLSELFQSRYPHISRDNRSNNTKVVSILVLAKKSIDVCFSIIDTCFSLKYFLFSFRIFPFPDALKPSLLEIFNNSFLDYDFLKFHRIYLSSISRKFSMARCLYLPGENKIYSQQLTKEYDIFHCTHLSPLTVQNLPHVTTIHDIIPLIRPELVSNQSLLVFAKLLRVNIANSVKIIAVSQATKDDLINYCQVPAEKITVVYEAAREEFKPVNIELAKPILRSLSLIDSEVKTPYFVFIGNIEPKKNIKRLLLAFKQFSMQDKQGCKLVIVGNLAWGFDDVRDLLQELINAGIIIHTGYLQTNQLSSLLSHAQALVFPSLIEGFGLPVLEAMACGCPVITSDIPCIQEITGNAAIRVNPLSIDEIDLAIRAIADNDSLRDELRHAGLLQSRLFSWQRCAKETLDVYHEAINIFSNHK